MINSISEPRLAYQLATFPNRSEILKRKETNSIKETQLVLASPSLDTSGRGAPGNSKTKGVVTEGWEGYRNLLGGRKHFESGLGAVMAVPLYRVTHGRNDPRVEEKEASQNAKERDQAPGRN